MQSNQKGFVTIEHCRACFNCRYISDHCWEVMRLYSGTDFEQVLVLYLQVTKEHRTPSLHYFEINLKKGQGEDFRLFFFYLRVRLGYIGYRVARMVYGLSRDKASRFTPPHAPLIIFLFLK